jgi:hypothetical protein
MGTHIKDKRTGEVDRQEIGRQPEQGSDREPNPQKAQTEGNDPPSHGGRVRDHHTGKQDRGEET